MEDTNSPEDSQVNRQGDIFKDVGTQLVAGEVILSNPEEWSDYFEQELAPQLDQRSSGFRALERAAIEIQKTLFDRQIAKVHGITSHQDNITRSGRRILNRIDRRNDGRAARAVVCDVRLQAQNKTGLTDEEFIGEDISIYSATQNEFYTSRLKLMIGDARLVDKSEQTIWNFLNENIQSFKSWKAFEELLKYQTEFGDGSLDQLLQMLAIDVSDQESPGNLQAMLINILPRDEGFTSNSVVEWIEQDDALNNWADLILAGRDSSLLDVLMQNQDRWPEYLNEKLSNRRQDEVKAIILRIQNLLSPYVRAIQQIPVESRTTDSVLQKNLTGKRTTPKTLPDSDIEKQLKRSKQKKPGSGRYTPSSKPIAATNETEPENSRSAVKITNERKIVWGSPEDLNAMMEEFLSDHPGDTELREALNNFINALEAEPFGEGTIPIRQVSKMLNDNGVGVFKLRRFKPSERVNLPTKSAVAKETRILYFTKRRESGGTEVGIYAIVRHDDYDRMLKRSFR